MSDPFDPSGQGQKPPESAKWEKDKAEKPEWKEDKDESKSESKDLIGPEMIIEPPIGASVPVFQRLAAPPSAAEREALLRHAEALEASAQTFRHFIALAERPDLKRGALSREPEEPSA